MYLVVLGFSGGTWDLRSSLRMGDLLIAAYKIFS